MSTFKSIFRIGLLVSLILMINPGFMKPEAQSYDKLWEEVDALLKRGLPRSAIELIDVVQQNAISEKNGQQLLKAAIYRFSANQQFEEEHLIKAIAFAQSQLPLLQTPEKQLMHSILAELYGFYYQQNRHTLLDRTTLFEGRSDDIRQWDLNNLRDAMRGNHQLSLGNADSLKKIKLADYKDILILPDPEGVLQQPYLYDFLVHRSLGFYLSQDAGLKQAGPKESFTDERLFAETVTFINMVLPTAENDIALSLSFLQELIRLHFNSQNIEALLYNEIKRFELLHSHYRGSADKPKLYEESLGMLLEQYGSHPASTDVAYALANFLVRQDGIDEEPERLRLNEALQLCRKAMAKHPDSRGAANCKVIKDQILHKELDITVQRVNSIMQPIPVLLNYRNITQPAFRLIAIESDELTDIMGIINQENKLKSMLELQPLKSWQLELPFEEDYRNHTTVIDLPALENGLYLLLASLSDFSGKSIIKYASFQVSNLSFISSKRDGINHFYLLDRDSGKPVRFANIKVMSREYDYNARRYAVEQRLELRTALDGSFSFGAREELAHNRAFYVEAETRNDKLYSDNYFDVYQRRASTRTQIRTWFFTDRAIYRPGQTIYFKGIVLEKQGDDYSIMTNQHHTVTLYDANGQEVSSLKLKTNDYGSFEGSFTAPLGALTGEMRISNRHGSTMVSVEEYKRPAFEVNVHLPEGQYRLNDTVELKGEAMAFAGYPIDSVAFTYKVYREPFFPWRPFWHRMPPVHAERELVAAGSSFTRTDGSFSLEFLAQPDYGRHYGFESAYTYHVVVDVTDRNGETRSGSQQVRVGQKALILKTDLPEMVASSRLEEYKLYATNLQGEAVSTKAEIMLYRIEQADRLVRPALWPLPDRHLLNKSEFESLFPLDQYDNSQDWDQRERHLVFSRMVDVDGETQILIDAALLDPDATYVLAAEAKDIFGETVLLEQAFTLFDRESNKMPDRDLDWFSLSHQQADPGETVYLTVGTAAASTRMLVEVFSGSTLVHSEWMRLNNRKKTLAFDVKEEHRGMLRFQAVAVRHNRILSYNSTVKVPHSDKKLNIELITRRDKLSPGAAETWELKITGHDNKAVAAELLASMYDASLDQFRPNNWHFNLISYPAPQRHWTSDNGFLTYRSATILRQPMPDRSLRFVRPPQLNWFGFYGGYGIPFTRGRSGMPFSAKEGEVLAEHHQHDVALMDVIQGDDDAIPGVEEADVPQTPDIREQDPGSQPAMPATRTRFDETAFFYPQLRSEADGSVRISFTLPDALTRWRLMLLAHTQDLKTGMQEYQFTASKALMIVPNTTRFYREGDTAWLAAKVVNTSDKILTGIAWIEVFDALTQNKLDYVVDDQLQKPFISIKPGRSQDVRWKLPVGDETHLLGLRFFASAGNFTDSESQYIPVLPRKVLVTETMPLYVKGGESRDFVFESLRDNPDRKNHYMQLDFTANPVWYAVQALPYLQHESENNIGIFNRMYANSLSSFIANSLPNVMQVIESWKTHSPDALLSELEKNEDLKAVLLNETPWVMQARSQREQKQNIALLFDLNRMRYERQQMTKQLADRQLPNGAWPWFKGMRENRFVTQSILTGIGRLQHMGVAVMDDHQVRSMVSKAIAYLDQKVHADIIEHKKQNKKGLQSISPIHLNYLYARSFFIDIQLDSQGSESIDYLLEAVENHWVKLEAGMQGMAITVLNRYGKQETAYAIMESLRERALHKDEFGTYWQQQHGFFWHQTPVENQVWLIEAFVEMQADADEIDGMRTWLLSQKRTTHWRTGRATADAVYALLMHGTDWMETRPAEITIAGHKLPEKDVQAGTGYISHQWHGAAIKPEMAEIRISNPNEGMAWGGVYLQFFENIDEVKGYDTPLQIQKDLFVKKVENHTEVLMPLDRQRLKIGDEIVVRIVLKADRAMEFVHLKDERAAAFEPFDVLSGYNWRDGLGFYQSTADASTDFFFSHLPAGTYVFEYSLRASHSGDYAAGRAIIQCLYAPEFAAHSQGVRVMVLD